MTRLIGPGGVQWMTAGRGILHSEMPEQKAGLMHGFQLWVNLPRADKISMLVCRKRRDSSKKYPNRRLDEPVAKGGPFVMNTRAEVVQAAMDYQSGKF